MLPVATTTELAAIDKMKLPVNTRNFAGAHRTGLGAAIAK
jgi:hypothetical protein